MKGHYEPRVCAIGNCRRMHGVEWISGTSSRSGQDSPPAQSPVSRRDPRVVPTPHQGPLWEETESARASARG